MYGLECGGYVGNSWPIGGRGTMPESPGGLDGESPGGWGLPKGDMGAPG